jgi:hypothetical protein
MRNAVEPDIPEGSDERMREDTPPGSGVRVVTNEDSRVIGSVLYTLHLHQCSRPGADQSSAVGQLIEQKVVCSSMTIRDDDLLRPGLNGRPAGRRHFLCHPASARLVVESTRPSTWQVGDTRHALNVCTQEDSHFVT